MREIREGFGRVAIDPDPHGFAFDATSTFSTSLPAWAPSSISASATVDVLIGPDPLQRGVLSGVKSPRQDGRLVISIPMSGAEPQSREDESSGLLSRPVTRCLPDDLVQAVLAGLVAPSTRSGDLWITGAGYDWEGGSYTAMNTAARILSIVLHAPPTGMSDRDESTVRALLGRRAR